MLDRKGFDLWAEDYDRTVDVSEEAEEYPFARYKAVLGGIYSTVRQSEGKRVLDIGCGTGVLTKRLYDDGYEIFGVDFSEKMIQTARAKMPTARLIKHDFGLGLPKELDGESFDCVICTYALHHLAEREKIGFINELLRRLTPRGKLLIGDIAFETAMELEECRKKAGDQWDYEEIYAVAEELKVVFPELKFEKISFCAGIFTFENR